MAISDADEMAISDADGAETSSHEGENLSVSVVDSDLDESTKQTEWDEGESFLDFLGEKLLDSIGERLLDFIEKSIFGQIDFVFRDPETGKSLREIDALYGDEIFLHIMGVKVHRDEEARRRLELNALPEELRRRLEKMAEAKAGVYALKEKLEVLFELFLYVCLILESSTSKQTRKSKEDKCIVYILLLRSGVESNPGPRTWIDDIPAMQMATTGDLINLARSIGNGWRQLGLLLNVGEATLDHIEHDNKTMQEKIYRTLQKSPFKDSLMEMLLIIDDACNKGLVHVNWNDISDFISKNGQQQPTIQRDVADAILARLATLENQMTTVQTTQAEHADLKNKVTCLQAENEKLKTENASLKRGAEHKEFNPEIASLKRGAENRELKTETASLKRGAQNRNAEEGETSTDVKRVKPQ